MFHVNIVDFLVNNYYVYINVKNSKKIFKNPNIFHYIYIMKKYKRTLLKHKRKKLTKKIKKKLGGASIVNAIDKTKIIIEEVTQGFQYIYEKNKIAFANIKINDSTFNIIQIYVEPNYRSKGIGKFILKHLLKYAFDNVNIKVIKLENLTHSLQYNPNDIPNKMYEKAGFLYVNPNDRYHKNDMILNRETYENDQMYEGYLNT